MRNYFDEQLRILNEQLTEMGAKCEEAIDMAVDSFLISRDCLNEVAEKEKEIDQYESDIENLCLRLLLKQQPVARDLRAISSALKMISDMERIGDQALDIVEVAQYVKSQEISSKVHLAEMAKATKKMVDDSIDAYVNKDLEKARYVISYDDIVDKLFDTVKREVIDALSSDSKDSEFFVDIIMIAKYLERIGDHATNIAEWVEFSITGTHE